MEKRNPDTVALVLRLPKTMLSEVDLTAEQLRMSRSAYIRKSLTRNLMYSEEHELPLVQDPDIQLVLTP
jgi:metal-responsive CopG/Arc/MetJ family transcriptional regulator